jgi:hypothetical protein
MSAHRPASRIEHHFVELVPDELEPDTLYISVQYGTIVHSCLCGCGERVVTPLTPTDWHLTYDGETITLSRSVGNWSFPCQSHYWIEHSRVHWSGRWSKAKIDANRASDENAKQRYFAGDWPQDDLSPADGQRPQTVSAPSTNPAQHGWWRRLRRRVRPRP